jgi:circadian clock protein KaiC
MSATAHEVVEKRGIAKTPSGIQGLDEITGGGLPRGRPALICGGAGCGKTLFGVEFLVRGATQFDEPGVFMAFEETVEELAQNVRSLGFDLNELVAQKKIALDHVHIERSEIEETGEYDLDGIFIRLGYAIDSIGAKRVVLDTLESLFGGLANETILRSELRRLFRWLKDKGVTTIITGERGDGGLTRQGMEEYVSDCVILLDHRVLEQISTRRLRIVKYRGSIHGSNEYPFLIDEQGISVLPVTSFGLQHEVSNDRISSGVARLDTMLGGQGYYRGTSVLVSGSSGSGKTSLSASFINAACRRGEQAMYFAFEESQGQLTRNMRSIGIDLEPWIDSGLLRFHATRPTLYGLEMHLATIHKWVNVYKPQAVVIDPVSNFTASGTTNEVKAMLMRLLDFFKSQQITAVFTDLTSGGRASELTEVGVSSLMDTWLLLRDSELNGERNRSMYILKSRGMPHSNQLREFLLTDHGIELLNVYLGPDGVLTGSARLAQEAKERAEELDRQAEIQAQQRELDRQRHVLELQIAAMRADFQAKQDELSRSISRQQAKEDQIVQDRFAMGRSRKADFNGDTGPRESSMGTGGQS